jgi:hypothetical protein
MNPKELFSAGDRSPFRFVATGSRRIYSRSFFYLITALTAVILFGCDVYYGKESKNTEKSKGTQSMDILATTEEKTAAIPPIDAAAPLQTATATFALG